MCSCDQAIHITKTAKPIEYSFISYNQLKPTQHVVCAALKPIKYCLAVCTV